MKIVTNKPLKVIGAKVINLKTGAEEDLIQKPDYRKVFSNRSDCLFKEDRIRYNGYEIQLRFDFSSTGIDQDGDPTLDVDYFYEGKKIRLKPHHISKTCDGDTMAYRFKFDDFEMVLKFLRLTKVSQLPLEYKVKSIGPNGEILIQ